MKECYYIECDIFNEQEEDFLLSTFDGIKKAKLIDDFIVPENINDKDLVMINLPNLPASKLFNISEKIKKYCHINNLIITKNATIHTIKSSDYNEDDLLVVKLDTTTAPKASVNKYINDFKSFIIKSLKDIKCKVMITTQLVDIEINKKGEKYATRDN